MVENSARFDDDSAEAIAAKLKETFREEAYELLAELEAALLELETSPTDAELIGRVFRALHTIKGSGATCMMNDISAFAHEMETFFDMVRKGKITVTKEIIDLTLAGRDQIKAMFDVYYRGGEADISKAQEIIASFSRLSSDRGDGHDTSAGRQKTAPAASNDGMRGSSTMPAASGDRPGRNVTYRIRFRPAEDIFERGTDPVQLMNELCQLGHCKVVAQTNAIPYLEDFNPKSCYTYWDAILTTCRGINAIQDIFIFLKDSSELKIEFVDEEGSLENNEAAYKRLDEILLERGDLTPEGHQKVLKTKKLLGEMLVEAGLVTGDMVESALIEQQHVREMRVKRQSTEVASSIRVATDKLDRLVDLVGELVTAQARLSQVALSSAAPELLSVSEEIERLTEELRDRTMGIRMMPIGTTFSKFRRLVRDLSRELGREAELATDGAETELDKTVIERLSDPLVHLIRNSVDHGIESPDIRAAAGKPRMGSVELSALHSGAHVLIRIADDGAGLDAAAIRAKAVEKGLIHADADLSDKDLFSLIFTPGFSTAKKVTGVSGRGVGLDVVKKAIDALRGSIEIGSRKGVGTEITLKLPLTLVIIEGLLVRIAGECFVFPLSYVRECVELTGSDGKNCREKNIANVRGDIVPYIRLREQFGVGGEPPSMEQIVVTEVNGARVGFLVDTVIGDHQTVIKNLGRLYREAEGISGATILGDGAVALILDVPKLARLAEVQEKEEANTAAAG